MQRLVRRYGAWQVRDYVMERGLWTAAAGLALLAIFWLSYDTVPPAYLTDAPTGGRSVRWAEEGARAQQLAQWIAAEPTRFRSGVEMLLTGLGFLGTLIATHGIVSRDRERGFYRCLFAKPVDAVAYYGQAFAINGLGLMVVSAGLLGATALAFGRAVSLSPLAVVGAEYALLGGTVFLLSTLWRFDFVLAALTWPVAALVAAFAHERLRAPLWARVVEPLLPPVYAFGQFVERAYGPTPVELFDPLLVVGYGAFCFAAGLFVLDRRARAGA
jgi:ABC-type transport system involved in multi-copper enzyme maturation permease subunit